MDKVSVQVNRFIEEILVEQNHKYHVSIKIEHVVSACNCILFTFQVTQSVG